MATKIIVSYDGTDNDRRRARARPPAREGRRLARARLRPPQPRAAAASSWPSTRPSSCSRAAQRWLGEPGRPAVRRAQRLDARGAARARGEGAAPTRSCSAPPTGRPRVTSTRRPRPERLLEGGPLAIAIAPAGCAYLADAPIATIAAVDEDGDTSAAPDRRGARQAARLGDRDERTTSDVGLARRRLEARDGPGHGAGSAPPRST